MANKIGSKALMRNPYLKPFETLVGKWQTTGSHPYFPDAELTGRVSFEWIEDGAFVMMRSEIDHPQFPDGMAIFGSDDEARTCNMVYFDERGVSRIYEASITESQLKWWRDDSHLSQRFTMAITKDNLVTSGEMSRDGGEWEKDLSQTYKKL
ncbi:MAG: hypothetical protein JWN01_368 [Patescibacteria group bacterium]|jgi:hypothetical protein|nr:hypothetical protein [Patescibacteria group bacterium]